MVEMVGGVEGRKALPGGRLGEISNKKRWVT
jgi:hypothetical protein